MPVRRHFAKMTCKLCMRERPLRNSHIIPEFLYRPLYDEKSRAQELDGATGKKRVLQKGLQEKLLCDECEGVLQRDEHYFSLLWFESRPLPDPVEAVYIERNDLDFDRFFRFHLSILYRASISSLSPFSAVSLGPFEEPYRQFLNGDVASLAEEPQFFGAVLRRPESHELVNWIVLAPVRARPSGVLTYTFVFGGCSWEYCVSSQGGAFPESLRLRRPGRMIFPVIEYTKLGAIKRAWDKWEKNHGTGCG